MRSSLRAWFRKPGVAGMLILGGLLFLAYLPSLSGDWVVDDERFISRNPAVQDLSLPHAIRFFTDPSTMTSFAAGGIYRPLRTLDFAIDWSIAGNTPWFFRLRSLLYQIVAAGLVWALFCRLTPGDSGPLLTSVPFFAALVFALHPVQVESVAYVSSRGDLLCLCFFLGALILHLDGRTFGSAVLLALALLSKETAVAFPVVAWITDVYARRPRPRPWRRYAVYAGVVAAYGVVWLLLVALPAPGSVAQRPGWPGGSWFLNLIVVGRGLLLYVKELLFPVDIVFDYYVPSRALLTVAQIFLAVLGFGIFVAAILDGRRIRFAALWFLLLLLPVSGLLVPVAIPTTERWLLLPSVAFCLVAATILVRTRLCWVVLACLLALTASRAWAWHDFDRLSRTGLERAPTPLALGYRAIRRMQRLEKSGSPEDARAVLRSVDRFFDLYDREIQGLVPIRLAVPLLVSRANALMVLGRPEEALAACEKAQQIEDADWMVYDAKRQALLDLGRTSDAVRAADAALRLYDAPVTRVHRAAALNRLAGEKEREGRLRSALSLYRSSWQTLPNPALNAEAMRGIRRLR